MTGFNKKLIPSMEETKAHIFVLNRATYYTFLDEQDRRSTISWNEYHFSDVTARSDGITDDCQLTWRVRENMYLL